jgi:ABC-type ATPase with predicted acetyltransferase domain
MRDRRGFRIRTCKRTYDKVAGKFSFNISYQTHTKPTPRSIVIAEAFGLGIDEDQKFKVLDAEFKIGPQDVVYITGDSGSGKSVLLRAIRADLGEEAIDLSEVAVDADKPLIETIGVSVEEGLEMLSRVGLNDAFLFLRSYCQLSDGQKYRYRIAKLIESGKQWWLMDEFAACLDRDTAKVISFNLQKIARSQGKAVIVATTHGDLIEDLSPSVLVQKRFGEEISIQYRGDRAFQCSLVGEMKVEVGSREDWQKLCSFHYRGHKTSVVRKFFRLTRGVELCGVIVYTYPPPACFGRRMVLPRMSMQEINQQLSTINRLVIHPKYRTIGLGAKLIRESLPMVGTDYVELIAVMAKYSPFAEKAGMKRIIQQTEVKSVVRISQTLSSLGFDVQLLGSQHYVKQKLDTLDTKQLRIVRKVLVRNPQPRLKKEVTSSRHMPYGITADYVKYVEDADSEKLAKLIKTVALLLQTKVYLFWSQQSLK